MKNLLVDILWVTGIFLLFAGIATVVGLVLHLGVH